MTEHEVFGESLARFESRGFARRACDDEAASREFVRESFGERRFAADNRQLYALALGEVCESANVCRAQLDAFGDFRYSGVSGRAEESLRRML